MSSSLPDVLAATLAALSGSYVTHDTFRLVRRCFNTSPQNRRMALPWLSEGITNKLHRVCLSLPASREYSRFHCRHFVLVPSVVIISDPWGQPGSPSLRLSSGSLSVAHATSMVFSPPITSFVRGFSAIFSCVCDCWNCSDTSSVALLWFVSVISRAAGCRVGTRGLLSGPVVSRLFAPLLAGCRC